MSNHRALIVGASQGIGLGFVQHLLDNSSFDKVYAAYRHPETATKLFKLKETYPNQLICLSVDVTEEDEIVNMIQEITTSTSQLHLVINCVGILHDQQMQPEKSLRQINPDNLLKSFQVNSVASVLLAKHLLPLLKHKERNIFAAISAKVGSIEDNYLGGWYGYRASKAALNMFMRTISLEYKRRSPQTIVVSLHPGTTDTQLSKPFQKNVPPEKLFSIERTTSQLLTVIDQLTLADSGQFFSWDGSKLPW
ncbi:MAG: SDR family NAD(P)-dependent oxidoreductase [Microcystaceae cyanobacterium]